MAANPFLSSSWYRVSGLRPKLRSHAKVRRHQYFGQTWYVVQDLASGRVHRLSVPAYILVAAWNGAETLDACWSETAAKLGDAAPSQSETIQLLSQLYASDLLEIRDVPPDLSEMFERYGRTRRSRIVRTLLNPLALRLPLWDPDPFLQQWLWLIRPLFTGAGAAFFLAVVVPAAISALAHGAELTANIADRAALLAPGNLVLIGITYIAIKLLHEMGHAFSTKVFGGEVHELGVIFLVLFPMPYVDASASAAFKDKWARIMVGAAGMAVELFLASLALYVWLLVEPGIVKAIAFDVMLIAGISTILFNGNPLLRYDGYYVLMDLLEIPNLSQKSGQYWAYLAERHLFREPAARFDAHALERTWLMVYGPLAFVYRATVIFAIALFLPTQYLAAGFLLAFFGLLSTFALPLVKVASFLVTSPKLQEHRARAIATSLSLLAAALFLVFLIPAPFHTDAEGVVWLPDTAYIRAGTDGFVDRVVATPGDHVGEGEDLIENVEPALFASVQSLTSRVEEFRAQLASEDFSDPEKARVTETQLRQAQTQLKREAERSDELQIRSKAEGTFVLSRPREDLPGRFFHEGEVIGYVTPASSHIVRVAVPQEDIDLVRGRLTGVIVKLTDYLEATFAAQVVREVPAAADVLPSKVLGAAGGGRFAIDPRDPNGTKTLQRIFQFDLELPPEAPAGNFGSRVFVRFEHDWEPVGVQAYRRIRQLLLSRLQT